MLVEDTSAFIEQLEIAEAGRRAAKRRRRVTQARLEVLRVEWEVSSVPAILDLVSAGIGHAALAEDAIRPFQHLKRMAVTPIVQPGAAQRKH